MNVQELIDALQAVEDKSRPVLAEGCDCINPVKGLNTDPNLADRPREPVLIEVEL